MKQEVLIGQTDYTVLVKIRDDAGAPATGLTEASIDIAYARVETDNDVTTADVTPAALSALTDAHTDWGFEEVSATDHPGLYRLDIADAVFASGAWSAVVTVTGTGLDPADLEFVLVAFNPRDGVRLGLTALPNAAADAAGGLIISDAGGLDADAQIVTKINSILADTGTDGVALADNSITAAKIAAGAIDAATFAADVDAEILSYLVDDATRIDASALNTAAVTTVPAIVADTNELQTDWVDGGRLDLILDARSSQASVDDLPTNAELATSQAAADDATLAAIAALNNLSAAQVNAEVDTALADINLDHLVKSAVDTDFATTVHLNSVIGNLADNGTSATFDRTTDSLEALQGVSAPSAASIADAVWEETLADHSGTTGSTAEALNAAGAAGDPWTTALPGAYGAGSAGKIIGDNINATISSRASQTSVDDLPTNAELATSQASADDATLAAIAALNNISTAQVNAEVDAALADINLDHLVKIAVDTNFATTVHADSVVGQMADNGAGFDRTTDSLEAIRDRGDTAWITATGFSTHSAADVWAAATRTLTSISDSAGVTTLLTRITAALEVYTAANVRSAVGLASANLDTQLGDLPTNSELTTALAGADDAVLAAIAALNNLSAAQVNAEVVDALITDVIADSVATDGSRPTIAQALLLMYRFMLERSVSGTTLTVKKEDGATASATFTLNDATSPTSITRVS